MKESNIIIRIDNELKERLKIAAKKESLPMSKLVLKLVTEYLNVEPQIKPLESLKEPIKATTNQTPLKRPQRAKGIYSGEKRKSAKDSPNRTVIKF